MTSDGRPTPRTRPRPAADEGTDPVASAAAPAANATGTRSAEPAPAQTRRGPERTVQLNVRIAEDVADILEHALADAQARSNTSKRQVVEHAIRATYS